MEPSPSHPSPVYRLFGRKGQQGPVALSLRSSLAFLFAQDPSLRMARQSTGAPIRADAGELIPPHAEAVRGSGIASRHNQAYPSACGGRPTWRPFAAEAQRSQELTMAEIMIRPKRPSDRFRRWLLTGHPEEMEGPYEKEKSHHEHPWWQVMCLTGVDYFSTLGYQPGIAALAAGALAPIATLILVLLTLLGALPMYRRWAEDRPHGEGSIAMLERLLSWWVGKLFVLCLLGFVATDFVITITLSAADATAHMLENPFVPPLLAGQRVGVTLLLVALLGAIFLKGFKEAIGIAVALVLTYLALNAVVVVVALAHVVQHPLVVDNWQRALFAEYHDPARMVLVALLLFPKLALGLSGFETGVAVMPLVRGAPGDTEAAPTGRIRNTRKLLLTAALIMSVFLIASSFATITLIPAEAFAPDGKANGRALRSEE